MIRTSVTISNKLGLHARASAKLTQLAAKYQSEVWMTRNKRRVNAKSIMGVMLLGTFSGFTYLLAEKSRQVTERLQTATTGKADDFFNFSE